MTNNRKSPKALDRRLSVRTLTLGGAMVGLSLVSCLENTTVEPTGTVEVRVSGLAPQGVAGTVTVTEPDGSDPGISVILPDADALGVSVGIATNVILGTYRITYSPLASHVITDPDDFEDLTVEANQTASAEFIVQVLTGTTGTLEVAVSGLTSSAAGTVTVTALDGSDPGVSIPLPDADAQGISLGVATNVPVGTYRITYSPPSSHVITDPDDFEDVTVEADQMATVEFVVQVMTGTLEVAVSGLTSVAGGTVAVTELDGSDPGVSILLPGADAQGESVGVATNVPVRRYRITYSPPANHVITDPDNFEDVTVVANQTARAEFTVQWAPAPAVAFASDWGAATGNSRNALTDGSKWSGGSAGTSLNVVSASGLDFPTTNVLRVEQAGRWGGVNADGLWPLPNIGETIYFRIYWRNGVTSSDTRAGDKHPIQSCSMAGNNCGDLWWKHNYPGGSTWRLRMGAQDGTGHLFSPGRVMLYNTTYRMEWAMTRIGTTTWNLHARVYDSSGVLVYSDEDFTCVLYQHGETLADLPIVTTNDPTSQQERLIGYQGTASIDTDKTGEYMYFGAYATSLSDWIGPYIPGEGS